MESVMLSDLGCNCWNSD